MFKNVTLFNAVKNAQKIIFVEKKEKKQKKSGSWVVFILLLKSKIEVLLLESDRVDSAERYIYICLMFWQSRLVDSTKQITKFPNIDIRLYWPLPSFFPVSIASKLGVWPKLMEFAINLVFPTFVLNICQQVERPLCYDSILSFKCCSSFQSLW